MILEETILDMSSLHRPIDMAVTVAKQRQLCGRSE